MRLGIHCLLALGATIFSASHVRAAPVCIEQHTDAQSLRTADRLLAAREQLVTCASDDTCPGLIRDDCASLVSELGQQIPSLVFAATDADGHDTLAVRVSQDGRPVLQQLTVDALELDPGTYVFRFESQGLVVEQELVLRDGERHRRVTIDFRTVATKKPPLGPPTPVPRPRAAGTSLWLGYGLLGIGVLGIGAGSVFGLEARAQENESNTLCDHKDLCDAHGVSLRRDAKISATLSTIGFSVGLVGVALGTYLFVSHRREPQQARGARFEPLLAPGFAGAQEEWLW